MRRNPGEADRWVALLKSGQTTPSAIEARIKELRTERDDAVFFKRPAESVAGLDSRIRALEEALASGVAAWEGGLRERQAAYAHERVPAPAPSGREIQEREVRQLEARARTLRRDLDDALRFRDPPEQIELIRQQIYRADSEAKDARSRLTTRNPRRRAGRGVA